MSTRYLVVLQRPLSLPAYLVVRDDGTESWTNDRALATSFRFQWSAWMRAPEGAHVIDADPQDPSLPKGAAS